MKTYLSSSKFKNLMKMLLVCSAIIAFFLQMGFHEFYDYIFPVVFLVLTVKYFSVED